MTERTTTNPEWVPTFLATLAATGVVREAIAAAGIAANSAYYRRKKNALFAEAWDAALLPAPTECVAPVDAEAGTSRKGNWKTCFLEGLAETSSVTMAARRANVPATTVYKLRRQDPAFAAKWLAALHEGYDHLEMELLGYLRDPAPRRKMDVAAALRLLAAHRETVERRRAVDDEEDEQAVLESIDRFIDEMRVRRDANNAILIETGGGDGTE
jgi:hypothetical protein